MHRWLAVLLVLALAAPAVAAAQDNPFGPLPQPAPSPAPTAPPDDTDELFDTGSRTLFVIAGALLIAFLAIGWWISRDARRFVPRADKQPALREQGPHRHARQAKAKARAKTRAQRAARRRNR